jgi:hypothetical protein
MSDGRVTIRTNNVPRFTVDPSELTPAERDDFDYLDWAKIDAGADSATFVRFRGELYSLDQFRRVEPGGDFARAGWHGIHNDSFFSGVLIRMSDDGEQVTLATSYC